jgi:hypothetical protein
VTLFGLFGKKSELPKVLPADFKGWDNQTLPADFDKWDRKQLIGGTAESIAQQINAHLAKSHTSCRVYFGVGDFDKVLAARVNDRGKLEVFMPHEYWTEAPNVRIEFARSSVG